MDITSRLRGKTVEYVVTNGHQLVIRATDGSEMTLCWADDNGRPIKGKPVVMQSGVRTHIRGLQAMTYFPSIRTRGEA